MGTIVMTRGTRRFCTILMLAILLPLVPACSTAKSSGGETSQTAGRQMFSPDVRGDPYARTQWEASVQALEQECRRNGTMCHEAVQARIAIGRKRSRI